MPIKQSNTKAKAEKLCLLLKKELEIDCKVLNGMNRNCFVDGETILLKKNFVERFELQLHDNGNLVYYTNSKHGETLENISKNMINNLRIIERITRKRIIIRDGKELTSSGRVYR